MQITNTFQNENDDILYKERYVVTHISIFLKGKLVGTEKIGKARCLSQAKKSTRDCVFN